jgi:hypothetical protein
MSVHTTNSVETYDYGICRSWLDEGRIVLIKTEGDMSRNAINTWASLLILTMQEWEKEKPLACLHDLTHPNQGLTPYTRARTADILKAIPNTRPMYSALVLPPTFMNRIIEMFIRTPIFRHPCHEIRVFGNVESGFAWLREKLEAHS